MGSPHVVSTPDGLGTKSIDGEAVVSVRGKNVGNSRHSGGVKGRGGAIGSEVVQRVRFRGVAAFLFERGE